MIALDLLLLAGIAGSGGVLLGAFLPRAVPARAWCLVVGWTLLVLFVAGVLHLALGPRP